MTAPHDDIHQNFIAVARELSPALAEAIDHVGPLAPLHTPQDGIAFRLSRAVAGQQLSVKAADTIWGRVLGQLNVSTECDPFCRSVLTVPDVKLRACGLSGAKTKTLKSIAQFQQDGALEAAYLASLPSPERITHLTQIWGVGVWTAQMTGMFYFMDEDIWPDGDVTARKTLTRLTSPRRKTVLTAKRFAPYRSRLARYMWAVADAPPLDEPSL